MATGLQFQESIYAEKEREAANFKQAGFDEKSPVDIPYIEQYAEIEGISLREAAEEILLQAQFDRDYLARTEKVRLTLFKKIRAARTIEEIEVPLEVFRRSGVV